jgi:hypothetical protein
MTKYIPGKRMHPDRFGGKAYYIVKKPRRHASHTEAQASHEGWPPLPALARLRILKIAELAYVIAPKNSADSKISENHSSITLLNTHFHPE